MTWLKYILHNVHLPVRESVVNTQSLEVVVFRHCLVFLGHSLRDCFKFVMVVACAELILRSQYQEGSPVYFLPVFV